MTKPSSGFDDDFDDLNYDDLVEIPSRRPAKGGPPPLPRKTKDGKSPRMPTTKHPIRQSSPSVAARWWMIGGGIAASVAGCSLLFFLLKSSPSGTEVAKVEPKQTASETTNGKSSTSSPSSPAEKSDSKPADSGDQQRSEAETLTAESPSDEPSLKEEPLPQTEKEDPQESPTETAENEQEMAPVAVAADEPPDEKEEADEKEEMGDLSPADLDRLIETAAAFVRSAKEQKSVVPFKEAVKTLRKASNRYPKDLRGDFYLGLLHSGVGVNDPKVAEMHFKRVLDRTSAHLATMNNLALVSIKVDKFAQARNFLSLAVKASPGRYEVNQNLGRLAGQARLLEIKRDELKRISSVPVDLALFRADTGWTYMTLDDTPKSKDEYKDFCRNGSLEDVSCSVCSGYGSLPCGTCGRGGSVVVTGSVSGIYSTLHGSVNVTSPTAATISCRACGGRGRVDCSQCSDGRDPSLRRH